MIWSNSVVRGVTKTVNGHPYVVSQLPFDAPTADVAGLVSQGAINIMPSGLGDRSGPTHKTNRPSTATVGMLYYDQDRQHVVVSDGDYWRDIVTGDVVQSHGPRT
jgi:hypothetical protein